MFSQLYIYIFALGVALLPFTRALTLDVGAPIKLYEGLFAIAMLNYLLAGLPLQRQFFRRYAVPLLAMLMSVCVSYAIFLFSDSRGTLDFRGGAQVDGILRIAYLVMNVFLFALGYRATNLRPALILRFWLLGMATSALYLIYCMISLTLTGEAIMLPGIERHQLANFGPIIVSRSGTFEEGNFGGLYFLLSAVLAYLGKQPLFLALAVLALIITKSTSAYFGAIAVFGFSILLRRKYRVIALPALGLLIASVYAISMYFASEGKFQEDNSSGAVRLNEVMTSLEMFKEHVFFGVGLGRYGFLYYFYHWNPAVDALTSSDRHIPNNIYAELLAETGLVGTLCFALFWLRWMKQAGFVRRVEPVFYACGIGMMVVWLAYPTFNIAFMWAFMGTGVALMNRIATATLAPPREPAAPARTTEIMRPPAMARRATR